MAGLLECVPNISDGRDPEVVAAVAAAFASAGATLLGTDSDGDHNRSVITIAGTPEQVIAGAVAGVAAARERIDLNIQEGAHPRMGATDVVPFVPLEGATTEDAVAAARAAAERIWRETGVPTYLYGEAARVPGRGNLANVRKGQFEGIRDSIAKDPVRKPDFGETAVHGTAGITAVGARFFLVAYNVNLDTQDLAIAKQIATAIREKNGGLPGVKALGFDLPEKGQVQVSMNLVDYRKTNPIQAFDEIAQRAEAAGVTVAGSEVVGLIPHAACPEGFAERVRAIDFDADDQILERRLAKARA
ncbi:MAG: glutamate formimidoyltransferase [Planctomycetota bacterium]|nr:glutamate formimidoyltransferase [Planctomycetota bacterium]